MVHSRVWRANIHLLFFKEISSPEKEVHRLSCISILLEDIPLRQERMSPIAHGTSHRIVLAIFTSNVIVPCHALGGAVLGLCTHVPVFPFVNDTTFPHQHIRVHAPFHRALDTRTFRGWGTSCFHIGLYSRSLALVGIEVSERHRKTRFCGWFANSVVNLFQFAVQNPLAVCFVSTSDHVRFRRDRRHIVQEGGAFPRDVRVRRVRRATVASVRESRLRPRGRQQRRVDPCLAALSPSVSSSGSLTCGPDEPAPRRPNTYGLAASPPPQTVHAVFRGRVERERTAVLLRSRTRVTRGQRYFGSDGSDRNAPLTNSDFETEGTRLDPGWIRRDRQLAIFHDPQRRGRSLCFVLIQTPPLRHRMESFVFDRVFRSGTVPVSPPNRTRFFLPTVPIKTRI